MLLTSSCSKDVLKSYDQRIVGTWRIIDIDRFGFSGNDNLPFNEEGVFNFSDDGQVTYNFGGTAYKGSWDIIRQTQNDALQRSLQLSVIDFSGQQMLSEYFNNIQFTGTDRFTAFIEYGTRTYVYRFRR
jgi:hypothetical protein